MENGYFGVLRTCQTPKFSNSNFFKTETRVELENMAPYITFHALSDGINVTGLNDIRTRGLRGFGAKVRKISAKMVEKPKFQTGRTRVGSLRPILSFRA